MKSLRSKLLVAVFALVVGSGLIISLLVTQRYSESLRTAITAQAENLAHAVALEATDKILINDLIALQKMLEHQMRSNPSLAYLFVYRDGRILAHTFSKGVPAQLIDANRLLSQDEGHLQRIASSEGEHYLDIAWPIFSGGAGVLRLGFSEKPFEEQVKKLWIQISLVTLGILLLAVMGSLIFVRRITLPLSELARATQRLDEGELDIAVDIKGADEVGRLASSFNQMVTRLKDYTLRLEQKAKELERSHNQTRTFCEIVREIGALPTLNEIGPALIKRFQRILICRHMVLLMLDEDKTTLFLVSENDFKTINDPKIIQSAIETIQGTDGRILCAHSLFHTPVVPESFQLFPQQALVPLLGDSPVIGGLVVACPENCTCDLKDIDLAALILAQSAGVLNRAIVHTLSESEFRARIETTAEFCGIIGKDPKMQVVYRLIQDIAPTDATVLVQGESGTGKELVARAIHQQSERRHNSFVVINCSAYPETLLESELFGHEKGAFTGAIRQRAGRFEQADGGTVFLDEIGEIPPSSQIKLLRVLQTQSFERLGGERTIKVDVRVIAATNKDLIQEVRKGNFREDLYYRLNVIPIVLPPLSQRPNDIPLLAKAFLKRFAAEQQKMIPDFSPESMRMLLSYEWPGNVRELENSVEHAVVLCKGSRIETSDLPIVLRNRQRSTSPKDLPLIMESERAVIEQALAESNWDKKKAARTLGIGRTTLYSKLRKYRIAKPTLQ
ncbi:sigma-54-dependent Fis family transcriptional regulator [Desulfomonile tiedjei]|uniref:Response regulator with CheY-like receiver, AAA-type ATPase, and DNA-binding domains n=1 Tax=Desulfomonile tiedjei (strain ATCC 49306 / DSM 6799 / DCB-1) TaxID=706587 RepID=I4CEI2_DESTA|nr:sigma-54-dependent Fis family transcriptional regulator [Desulfomonile tiedjei]AFM27973.1 response regulator with CheY-like receiver, AAA-type ATPase, and DNA-binding domains [Desulfomonile tiedjei DSM 6799]